MDKERELNSSKLAFKNASQKFSQLETRSMSIDNTASIKTKVNINKEIIIIRNLLLFLFLIKKQKIKLKENLSPIVSN